jgi:uroporphyrinogen decarboxylase
MGILPMSSSFSSSSPSSSTFSASAAQQQQKQQQQDRAGTALEHTGKMPVPHKDTGKMPVPHKDMGKMPVPHKDTGKMPVPHKDMGKMPMLQEEDHFGVPRVKVRVGAGESSGTYSEVAGYPLAGMSLAQIEQYPKWPSPDEFDYAPIRSQVEAARATGKVVVFMGDRTNRAAQLKPAMYLRGVEQILLDMAAEPEIARYIFHRIGTFYLEYFRRTLEAAGGGIDIFLTGDDFGTQTGLMVSQRMWTEFLRPGFEAFVHLGHDHGCRVAHHSCGSIKPIIGDMIDCGLDILNPLQPGVHDMDHAELKRLFGGRLCFHGSISIQRTLPYGSADDIRREVRQRFQTLAPGGGFVFCTAHNIQPDTPIENVLTLFKAYRELGRYSSEHG